MAFIELSSASSLQSRPELKVLDYASIDFCKYRILEVRVYYLSISRSPIDAIRPPLQLTVR